MDLESVTTITTRMIYAISLLMIAITIISIMYFKKLTSTLKNTFFWLITIPTIIATILLVGSTLYLNSVSPTHGPVHWHADYEVHVCNQEYELIGPRGLSNRVGTPLLHEHNDNRIHVEGTPLSLESINLGNYFKAVGGEYTQTRLSMPTNSGIITVQNGQPCNNLPGRLYLFVQSQDGNRRAWRYESKMGQYVLAPYSTIPPGDNLLIMFTEKNPEEILM